MPITYTIDHARRLVVAEAHGTLTDDETFGYQREVWSRADVAGYNELVDMTHVTYIALPSSERVRDLARYSASMDAEEPASKMAIVAPGDLAFGLGRMYATNRAMNTQSTKHVSVFRTRAAALEFLGISEPKC